MSSSRDADPRTSNTLATPLATSLSDAEIQALFDAHFDMAEEGFLGRIGPDYPDDDWLCCTEDR